MSSLKPQALSKQNKIGMMLFAAALFFVANIQSPLLCRLATAAENRPSPGLVGQLIEQLGSESYATRSRAKESLQRIGLEAFDQLQSAQFHPDNEIALTARYLITSLNVSWSKESDTPEVRETLDEYGGLSELERERRINRLHSFTQRSGLGALVRITNYERSSRLKILAAMLIMDQELPDDALSRSEQGNLILNTLANNERPATIWLRQYAQDLIDNHYQSSRWREVLSEQIDLETIRAERSSNENLDPSQTPSNRDAKTESAPLETASLAIQSDESPSREELLNLVRQCVMRAHQDDQQEEAIALAIEYQDLIDPTIRELTAACSWAIDHQLHQFVLELEKRHSEMFQKHPMLLYGAAEASLEAGEVAQGEERANRALKMNPLPEITSEDSQGSAAEPDPRVIEEIARAHRDIATQLARRGRFDWSEQELTQIIDRLPIDSVSAALARSDLALLYADLERHREVADILTPLIDRLEKDATLKQQLIRLSTFNYSFVISNAQYHTALAMIGEGDLEPARPLLAQAFQRYPVNVDILISMHQLDGDEAWRNLVSRTLEMSIRQIEQSIQDVREDAKRFGQPIRLELGYQLNQYAWLVANTEGNQEKALKYSLESLQISNDSAKMDTCARCYFAVGDFENAMRMQQLALKQSPYSPPLLRQLRLIENAIEAGQSAENRKTDS